MRAATFIGGMASILFLSMSTAMAQPSFTWIGRPPAATSDINAVSDISANGSAVVGYYASTSRLQSYRWTPTSGRTDFGPPNYLSNAAYSISGNGNVIAGTYTTSLGGQPSVFTITNGGPLTPYVVPPVNSAVVFPFASGDGSVIFATGEGVVGGSIVSRQPVRYTSPTTFDLLTAPAGGDSLRYAARDAADSGQLMVGDAFDTTRGARPYPTVWREGQGSTWLAVDESTFVGQATAVSRNGQYIAGGVYEETGPGRLAIWSDAGLSTFALPTDGQPAWTEIYPSHAADNGSIMTGVLRSAVGGRSGFVWTASGGIVTTKDFLVSIGVPFPLSSTQVLVDIDETVLSSDGNTIAGVLSIRDTATNQFTSGHFVATIPTPSTVLLSGWAAILLGCRRRRVRIT
jgi:uncharacterized membrane protein